MKKKTAVLSLLLVAMLMVTMTAVLAGCGGSGNGSSESGSSASEGGSSASEGGSSANGNAGPVIDVSSLKTMGDVFEATAEISDGAPDDFGEIQSGFSETKYVYAFQSGEDYYRVTADLPEDVSKKLWDVDVSDEDADQKQHEIVAPLEIAEIENLMEGIPSQEELDKLVGTKGQELFDDGWTFSQYNVETMECVMNHDAYAFDITFDYEGEPMKNMDDVDPEEAWKDSPVASISYHGIGDAANPEM